MDDLSSRQREYLAGIRRHRIFVRGCRILAFVLFLALWELSARAGLIDPFIFSSPGRILDTLFIMGADGSIFRHTGITLLETLASFALVAFFSLLASTLLWRFRTLSEILEPWMVVLNSLPKSALAPLLIVWLGARTRTIIVAGISVAIFGSVMNMYTAFLETDEEEIKLIYTLNGSRAQALRLVIFPSSLPAIISILKVNIGLCLVGVVIGEFIGSREGLGYLIIYGSQVFRLDMVLTSIVILCALAMGLYQIVQAVEKRVSR